MIWARPGGAVKAPSRLASWEAHLPGTAGAKQPAAPESGGVVCPCPQGGGMGCHRCSHGLRSRLRTRVACTPRTRTFTDLTTDFSLDFPCVSDNRALSRADPPRRDLARAPPQRPSVDRQVSAISATKAFRRGVHAAQWAGVHGAGQRQGSPGRVLERRPHLRQPMAVVLCRVSAVATRSNEFLIEFAPYGTAADSFRGPTA